MNVKRRSFSLFNLSFIDIMFCGFGAVVLLVLIINASERTENTSRQVANRDHAARLWLELETAAELRTELQEQLRSARLQRATEEDNLLALAREIDSRQADYDTLRQRNQREKEDLSRLQHELVALDTEKQQRLADLRQRDDEQPRTLQFVGEGNRQYLTGLKLDGDHVLILLDSSASMLDQRIVDIIIRRNLEDGAKTNAPKWRRALRTVNWLLANISPDSNVQVMTFNEAPVPVSPDGWIAVRDTEALLALLRALQTVVPDGPTSLINVFAAAAALQPPPDNIILITDGLPTISAAPTGRAKVSGSRRVRLFSDAIAEIPPDMAVNTILFPLEGDPLAAASYWQLAIATGGSLFTPTSDWP
jgi:Skp family chaperone for outer membrane proteins